MVPGRIFLRLDPPSSCHGSLSAPVATTDSGSWMRWATSESKRLSPEPVFTALDSTSTGAQPGTIGGHQQRPVLAAPQGL